MKSKSITIKIQCDNEAFGWDDSSETRKEVARILYELADRFMQTYLVETPIKDVNGNTCGSVKLTGF